MEVGISHLPDQRTGTPIDYHTECQDEFAAPGRSLGLCNDAEKYRRKRPMNTSARPLRRHQALERLLHPASIAVIGASPRPGVFGAAVLRNLGGYDGRVYPVKARYPQIGELVCYPSIGAVPETVDCALIATPREAVEPIVRECTAAGVGGVIVFASGYAETGRAERIAEQDRLAAIARKSGMALLGPNTVGMVNALCGAAITFMDITPVPPPRRVIRRRERRPE
jgi:acetate---CoA ligase (ADP-forming)